MISMKKLSIACLGTAVVSLAINKPASASVFFNSDTGHYYEFVPSQHTWTEAKVLAETRSYNGWQGYLATITSEAEHNFIASSFTTSSWGGWIGASDAATEGIWEWATGPEAGTVFLENGAAIGYNNFPPGQPDDSFGGLEEYAHIWQSHNYIWNDLPNDMSGVTSPDQKIGYYVEYGGLEPSPKPESVPEPSSILGLFALGGLGVRSLFKRKSN